jgi:hypothetical protein
MAMHGDGDGREEREQLVGDRRGRRGLQSVRVRCEAVEKVIVLSMVIVVEEKERRKSRTKGDAVTYICSWVIRS